MPCRCAPGHVVHHIPVSLLYWPWKSDVLKICTPTMQKATLSQKWMFYAVARAQVLVAPSRMRPLFVRCGCWCGGQCCWRFCLDRMLTLAIACVWRLHMCFLAFTATFISYAFLPMLFHAPPCRLLGCLSSDCAKVGSLCAQNACFVKQIKNSNFVSSCFSKGMYKHAKTKKIYPVGLNKTPIACRSVISILIQSIWNSRNKQSYKIFLFVKSGPSARRLPRIRPPKKI